MRSAFAACLLSACLLAQAAEETEQAVSDAAPAAAKLPVSVTGDFRLRYEHTTSEPAGDPSRDRGVVRGRLGATYEVRNQVTIGARLATGDADDPNSSDMTLGNFTDDLQVSLDRAYVQLGGQGNLLVAGKFANPLVKTDLVWDDDVNPQGVAGRHRLYQSRGLTADVTGIYAIVDEQADGADGDMLGSQISISLPGDGVWSARLSAGYYDYSVGSLANADGGDIRDNLLTPAGDDYVSDFDLVDLVAQLDVEPWGERWPVTVVADYVKNLGAAVSADTGYSGAASLGCAVRPGDVRLSYGYAVAETDAMFAAFSHDNITYATNYRQHSIGVDFVPFPGMLLNLTAYHYRRKEPLPGADNDALTRIRLNWSVAF
jgi:hypothetical protein